jgi:hypothetical protein
MAETMTIDRSQWVEQLDAVTREHEGDEITIEVLDKDWGDAHEAQRMPFSYVSYDKKDDVVIIGVGGEFGGVACATSTHGLAPDGGVARSGRRGDRAAIDRAGQDSHVGLDWRAPVIDASRHEGGWR